MSEEWISLREFSRRHDGVALSAVQKAIASGRVTAIKRDGTRIVAIEFYAASKQWSENTDPVQAARSGHTIAAPVQASGPAGQLDLAAGEKDALVVAPAAAGDKDPHGYLEARAKRERHQAEMAELDLLEQLGQLVSVVEMRQVTGRRYRAMRDKLLNIPDRIAAVLAAEKDTSRVHAALTAELKRVLHELSDDAGAEAARGVAERVAA